MTLLKGHRRHEGCRKLRCGFRADHSLFLQNDENTTGRERMRRSCSFSWCVTFWSTALLTYSARTDFSLSRRTAKDNQSDAFVVWRKKAFLRDKAPSDQQNDNFPALGKKVSFSRCKCSGSTIIQRRRIDGDKLRLLKIYIIDLIDIAFLIALFIVVYAQTLMWV